MSADIPKQYIEVCDRLGVSMCSVSAVRQY